MIPSRDFVLNIVDLPRNAYHVLPPRKWQVVITLAGIVATAILWGVLWG